MIRKCRHDGWLVPLLAGSALHFAASAELPREIVPGVRLLGRIHEPHLTECSGFARGHTDTNVFWVHNDGWRPMLYGISRTGEKLAQFPILGSALVDWEDLASDRQGRLYIADIGNNECNRSVVFVHRIREPDVRRSGQPQMIETTWMLRYPGKAFDSEALFIWQDYGYLVSKVFNDAPAEIYRFSLAVTKEPVTLEFVARLDITTPITAADISAQGARLVLMGHSGGFVLRIRGDVAGAGKAKEQRTKFKDHRIEGCCFVEDGVLAVAETRELYLFHEKGFVGNK